MPEDESTEEKLTLEYFFFRLPIYHSVKITEANWNTFLQILFVARGQYGEDSVEGYNPFKGLDSTFKGYRSVGESSEYISEYGGVHRIAIICKRYGDVLDYFIRYSPDTGMLTKVGQYPSAADFHIHKIKKYRKLLGEEKSREFTRAIGGAANGIGIGSFVYLRRIFESLILEAKVSAIENGFIKEKDYSDAFGMDERIKLLKDFLPDFLVENRAIYAILSLGVHELDEKTCLKYFDPVRVGIEIILDKKLEAAKEEDKIADAKSKIASVLGEIKSAKKGGNNGAHE